MRILSQDKRILINTNYIWCFDNSIRADIQGDNEERCVLGIYQSIEEENLTAQDIPNIVIRLMTEFFDKRPNNIYEIPTQEEIEEFVRSQRTYVTEYFMGKEAYKIKGKEIKEIYENEF